jgi:hypothetical protein
MGVLFSSLYFHFPAEKVQKEKESSLSKLGCWEMKSHLFTFCETHFLRLVQV